MSSEQALGQINRMVDQQAFMLAANDVFYGSSIIFLLLVPLVWLARPAKRAIGASTSTPAGAADAAAGAH
jgi:DHA2 family multidrug resistance protein